MDDQTFLDEFEAQAIPRDRWRHEDHVRMAYSYLRAHPFAEALDRMRTGIQALNRANRVPEGATSGYHETVTVAWALILSSAIRHHGPGETFQAFAGANPHLLSKTLLRVHYTRARLLTEEARSRFVEPDLAALPRPPEAPESARPEPARPEVDDYGSESDWSIRAIGAGDEESWVELRHALYGDEEAVHRAEVREFFEGRAAEPQGVLVAVMGERLLGLVELSVRACAEGCHTSNVGYLEGWYVRPEARHKGVGRSLVRASEEWARRRGCRELASDTRPDNKVGAHAHKACGFEDAGLVRCFRKDLATAESPPAG